MTASTFEWLFGLLDPLLDCQDLVGSPLNFSMEFQLEIGLFRLATAHRGRIVHPSREPGRRRGAVETLPVDTTSQSRSSAISVVAGRLLMQ
ncbi:hypothetical protein CRG98_038599 [Punica granatum]|uniref:Uncharacterized protein n=1 Tax=Punica granatum TaxID=22663 RepID=A0A2I0IAP5_PUNGR|nr:hypothetical protein CRG98_038599 [Punica granatum]